MHTQINVRRENPTWSKLRQCLGLLLFSLILAACSQGSDSPQGVISDDKLSAPFPKAITALLVDNSNLMVEVVINGDTDNPLQVENLVVDTTAGTFSGNVPGLPTGTYTLLLVYSIIDPGQGTVEVVRTSEITVDVVANEETPADFSAAGITYTDTDGDAISNLDELDAGTDIGIANYTVGGQIEGLMGSGLVLQNNGSNDLTISEDSTFSFSPAMIDGSDYTVDVLTQPNNPNQVCTVNNGSGTLSGAAVSNITVTCSTTAYTVGGTVSGYAGSGLVLQNNDGDDFPVSADGAFSFNSAVADGSEYVVSVRTHPGSPGQICTVNNGSGTVSGAAVSNVAVICSTTSYTVGGTVSGYAGSGLVLQNNNSDDLPVSANGTFSFSNAVADGSNYTVTILTQPNNPNQTCMVNNGSDTVSGAAVSSVAVTCSTTDYTVGGTVSGYAGSGLILQNNGSNDLTINTEGNFTFSSVVADGSSYSVTVLTQPNNPNQICTVSNGSDTVSGAAVSSVAVACATTDYTVGGTVSGYAGSGLILQNNGSNDLTINTEGNFTFSSVVADGSSYSVTVLAQPNNPNQTCTVSNGSDTVSGAVVSSVAVTCLTTSYTVGGTVSGYEGSGLVLQNNDGNDLPINTNGTFTFTTPLTDTSIYAVTVFTQPDSPNQTCTVNNDKGIVSGSTVTNITVACETTSYTIGGTIIGLVGNGLVLQNNGGDDLLISSNGDFTFTAALTDGSDYAVTVQTQPGGPNQTCTVGNDKGTVNSTTIIDVTVTCVTASYTIGGTVTGLIGGELVLQNNGGDDLVINADGDFTFVTALTDGSAYAVTVLTPPAKPTQRCTVENSEGVLEGGDANVTVSCQLLLFISADDGVVGQELFVTDGTTAGTSLIKDINTNISANPRNFVTVAGVIYFVVENDKAGHALWKTNGTVAGTVLVKDIWPGASGVSLSELMAVGSTLYFRADDGINGWELWKSDGTAVGTVLVKDIWPRAFSAFPAYLTAVGNTLYFRVFDDINGMELWKSDGTTSGTVLVKDIRPGSASAFPGSLTAVGNTLYFNASDGINGGELWKSDGTASGTVLVKDIWPGTSHASPSGLTAMGNTLYFRATDAINGRELWMSDGTASGTVLVKDIRPGATSTSPTYLTAVGSTLYFSASDGINGQELWKSDGTASGTVLVRGIALGSSSSSPSELTAVGNTLYFSATDGINGAELWKSDGTASGTVLVKDIRPGATSTSPSELTAVGSTLYFSADDGINGKELWKSDGTNAGTILVNDINTGVGNSFPDNFSSISGVIYFAADNGVNGRELWCSDGSVHGTYLLADIGKVADGSVPGRVVTTGGTSYFTANDGGKGYHALWRSDGTTAGTVLVRDVNIDSTLIAIGNTLYFRAFNGINGMELWKSDGTASGTVLVKDIWPGSSSAFPRSLTVMGNTLYFRANDGINGWELWKSDGTASGTVLVKDIRPGSASAFPGSLTAVGNTLYFSVYDGVTGWELWKSDGTASGTVLVKDIRPGASSAVPESLTAVGNMLYFNADDGANGRELWKSDGTAAGTVLVKDIRPGATSTSLSELTAMGNTLYFSVHDGVTGWKLWKSDGTASGTVLVKDIKPGSSDTFSYNLTAVGNTLYFSADDGANGKELWKSDGTVSGTVLVKDIRPGASSAVPESLTAVGNMLYFNADDGANGRELWKSDGTDAGTVMVKDLNSNFEEGSYPIPLNAN